MQGYPPFDPRDDGAIASAIQYANGKMGGAYGRQHLVTKSRDADWVTFRMHAAWFLRNECAWSFPKIGFHLGRRDHSTIMHLLQKHEKMRTSVQKSDSPHADQNGSDRISSQLEGAVA